MILLTSNFKSLSVKRRKLSTNSCWQIGVICAHDNEWTISLYNEERGTFCCVTYRIKEVNYTLIKPGAIYMTGL